MDMPQRQNFAMHRSNNAVRMKARQDRILQKVDLILSMLNENFSTRHFEIFSYFSQKIGFDIPCKLSPKETICMEY